MFDFEDGSRRISQDNTNINARLLNLIATLDRKYEKNSGIKNVILMK